MTMGMTFVAFLAARIASPPVARMTSGFQADQLRCERRQAFDAALCMPAFDDQVLALDVPDLAQRSQALFGAVPGFSSPTLNTFASLLRLDDSGPRRKHLHPVPARARADPPLDLSPPQTTRDRHGVEALSAVLRLITRSNFVDLLDAAGSAGPAPLRMLVNVSGGDERGRRIRGRRHIKPPA